MWWGAGEKEGLFRPTDTNRFEVSGGVMVTIIVCRLVVAVMRRKEEFCDGIKWLRWPCAEISVARTLMELVYTLGKRNFSCSRVRHGEC